MLSDSKPFQQIVTPPSVSCLIPCYNEAKRIKSVLTALLQVEGFDQILCVDDCSTDGTARVIVENFPSVHVLCMPKNRGKAEAVQAGVSRLSSDYIFLLDADLVGIRPGEFNQALRTIKTRPQIDMLVLRRIKKSWITRRLRGDVLITGERILYRDRLLNALKDQSVHGFQLEVALNQYALDQQWTVCWFPVSSLGEISFKKIGILGGLLKEVRMFYSLFSYLGVRGFIRQYRFFGQELIEKVG